MSRYLVTGAVGFIGSRITERLLQEGHEVVGLDNLNEAYDIRLKHWRLEQLQQNPRFNLVRGDIADRQTVRRFFKTQGNFEAIINLAARAGVRPSVENPWIYFEANLTGVLNLLDACLENGIGKFIQASTSSLYGEVGARELREDLPTDRPISPYAASKKAAEVLCYTYHSLHGVNVTIYRFFTVYGPAGRPDMSLFRFVQWISEDRPVIVFGDGTQTRAFTYVDDVARGALLGLPLNGYEIINLGSDNSHSVLEAIHLVEEAVCKKAHLDFRPKHTADVSATLAGIDRARKLLHWQPQTSLPEGIQHLVQWYRANRDWAKEVKTGLA